MRRTRAFVAGPLLAVLLAGCGLSARLYEVYDLRMASGDCEGALAHVEASAEEYGRNARLLQLLDRGTAALLCARYAESAAAFEEADRLSDELWTISLSRHAASYLLNDSTQPYGGEDFERVMINLLAAIDYLLLGRPDEALVEVRRMDEKLADLEARYGPETGYREDPFGRYLGGLIYEALGEWNDAFIDYRRALEAYEEAERRGWMPVPRALVADLLRVGRRLGLEADLEPFVSSYPEVAGAVETAGGEGGRVVLLHFDGRAPRKVSEQIFLPTEAGPVTMAFPRFETDPSPPLRLELRLVDGRTGRDFRARSFLAENVEAIALQSLEDRRGRVTAKAVARFAAKQAAIHGLAAAVTKDPKEQKDVQAVLNLLNLFLERADTRSWRTLPARIRMATLFVPEGRYRVVTRGPGGASPDGGEVRVEAGRTLFLFRQTMYR